MDDQRKRVWNKTSTTAGVRITKKCTWEQSLYSTTVNAKATSAIPQTIVKVW